MPFIHVKSLPFDQPVNITSVIEGLSKDFAEGTGTDLQHVSVIWEFLEGGHYAVGGETQSHQPQVTHPVLVDILTPDFNPATQIRKMLRTSAESISKRVNVPISNIFINHRYAHSGMVLDDGEIVQW